MRRANHEAEVKRPITFIVSDAMNNDLRDEAWSQRKSLSQLVREYCDAGLKLKKKTE